MIKLRALTSSDMELTLRWHNSDDIRDNYLGHPFPVNIEMESKWYEKILGSNFPVTVFGIEASENGTLVGLVMIRDINMINRSAEFAIYIGDEHNRGKGYASAATGEAVKFSFDSLGLHRVWLRVMTDNEAAIKLYEAAGFKREGTLRHSAFKDGSFRDEYVYALINEC